MSSFRTLMLGIWIAVSAVGDLLQVNLIFSFFFCLLNSQTVHVGEGACSPYKTWQHIYNHRPWEHLHVEAAKSKQVSQSTKEPRNSETFRLIARFFSRFWAVKRACGRNR